MSLRAYYRWHAHIYDFTRWAFLFGRRALIQQAARRRAPRRILEIGCGTGTNLLALTRLFPQAEIVGIDLSEDMLAKARRKVPSATLISGAYVAPRGQPFDLIVLSYCLTMINPGFDHVTAICQQDLSAGGEIAVVDFHESRVAWFRRWMGVNHVRMEGQVLAWFAGSGLRLEDVKIESAYGGLWRWFACFAVRD
ncbi:MAG: class I SAM-dependent methyltransferase [Bryobacteraceae bacterium]|nr:class I SAM-dependent methyltransferase [Bryobacteraceae bacterium]